MANYNFSRNNNRGLKAFAIIVTILLVAALVVGLFFIGKTTNGFTEMPTFDEGEVLEDGDVVVTPGDPEDDGDDEGGSLPGDDDGSEDPDGTGHGAEEIKAVMTLSRIQPSDYEDYGVNPLSIFAYDVQVTLTPSNADIESSSWNIELDTTYSGYTSSMIKDGNGQDWMSPSSVNISDYLEISSKDMTSCSLSCLDPFGCTMKLVYSVTDKRGNSFEASCKLDYKSYFQSQAITVKNVGNTYNEGLLTMTYTAGVGFTTSASVVAVDMEKLVNDSNYVFTVTPGSVTYTVGTLACEEALPTYSFEMSYGGQSSTDSSWSSITSTLFGTALGDCNIGDLTHEMFDDYNSGNPMITVTFTSSESLTTEVGIYFVNTECLTVPLSDVTMSTGQIIFG